MAAVTADGQLFTWGDGFAGKLGHGDTESVAMPRLVAGLSGLQARLITAVFSLDPEPEVIWQQKRSSLRPPPFISFHHCRHSVAHTLVLDLSASTMLHSRPAVLTAQFCRLWLDVLASVQVLGVACGAWHTAAVAREPGRGDAGHLPNNLPSGTVPTCKGALM